MLRRFEVYAYAEVSTTARPL